jgi:hypothetical protein
MVAGPTLKPLLLFPQYLVDSLGKQVEVPLNYPLGSIHDYIDSAIHCKKPAGQGEGRGDVRFKGVITTFSI